MKTTVLTTNINTTVNTTISYGDIIVNTYEVGDIIEI